MLRPQFQQKLRLAFLMLASALIIIAEPVYAKNSNGNNGRANRAASSSSASSHQSAPAAPPRSSAPAPRISTPAPRISAPSISVRQPTRSIQQPSSRSITTNRPSITIQQPSRPTQSRSITNNPSSLQSRSFTTSPQTAQPQIRSYNSITNNQSISSRSNNISRPSNTPSVNNQSRISSGLTDSLGFSIGANNPNSSSNSAFTIRGYQRSNSVSNRQSPGNVTNQSISQNNSITNRNTESIISSNRAGQPAASPNNRISSELSSHIGSTIGTQPESTTTVRNQQNRSSRSGVILPYDTKPGSQRTTPQTEVQRPAESSTNSSNRISSNLTSGIGTRIDRQTNSVSREQNSSISSNRNRSIIESVQRPNRLTPPSNSARQPAESTKSTSSLDRANTDIGIMISPDRTPPNNARQPAASLNNRENRSSSSNIIGQTREQANTQTRTQRQNLPDNAGRNNSSIGDVIGPRNSTPSQNQRSVQPQENNRSSVGRTDRRADRPANERSANANNNLESRSSTDSTDSTRISRINPDNQTNITSDALTSNASGRRDLRAHRYDPVQSSTIIYRDRPYTRDSYHSDFFFVDRYDHLYRRSITPRFGFSVCYNRGLWYTYGYVFPYYQRKYLFVSLDGYWPYNYDYLRYYWYGYHPYYWYGYYPMARQIGTDINYYYTYNYYSDSPAPATGSQYYNSLSQQQPQQPAEQTLADTYFEEAVDAFDKANYDLAVEKFAKAMALASNDMVLPFAYSQALFAAGRYSEAAAVLREAIVKTKPDQQGVFYPRGLYSNNDVLLSQLDKLAAQADVYSFDPDLQLLLGYQLLGINDLDQAVVPLKKASLDITNQQAATILLNLLSKLKTNDIESGVPAIPQQEEPNKVVPQNTTPVNPLPEKVEPNKALLNEQNTINLNSEPIAFIDSRATEIQPANTETQIIAEQASANEPAHQKAKEGVLLAALFVLAGTTGLGHFMHH